MFYFNNIRPFYKKRKHWKTILNFIKNIQNLSNYSTIVIQLINNFIRIKRINYLEISENTICSRYLNHPHSYCSRHKSKVENKSCIKKPLHTPFTLLGQNLLNLSIQSTQSCTLHKYLYSYLLYFLRFAPYLILLKRTQYI